MDKARGGFHARLRAGFDRDRDEDAPERDRAILSRDEAVSKFTYAWPSASILSGELVGECSLVLAEFRNRRCRNSKALPDLVTRFSEPVRRDLPTGQLPTWVPLDMCGLEQVARSATRRCLGENPTRCRSTDATDAYRRCPPTEARTPAAPNS